MADHISKNAILVGVDDSEGTRSAISWAGAAAAAYGCPLVFINAYPDLVHPPVRGFIPPEKELRGEAEDIVDRAEAYLASTGWTGEKVSRIVQSGPPKTLFKDHAEQARMVVVGRRGYGGFRDMLIGSTAYGIVEHSKVPVVVVPERWDGADALQKPIVLGLEEARDGLALAFGFEHAALSNARLRVVHVWQASLNPYSAGPSHWPPAGEFPETSSQWLDEQRRFLSEQIAGWGEKFSDVHVERDVLVGSPAGALLAEASKARLLVVGGRDHGTVGSALLGSVARNLMHHATCPLAIVHTGS